MFNIRKSHKNLPSRTTKNLLNPLSSSCNTDFALIRISHRKLRPKHICKAYGTVHDHCILIYDISSGRGTRLFQLRARNKNSNGNGTNTKINKAELLVQNDHATLGELNRSSRNINITGSGLIEFILADATLKNHICSAIFWQDPEAALNSLCSPRMENEKKKIKYLVFTSSSNRHFHFFTYAPPHRCLYDFLVHPLLHFLCYDSNACASSISYLSQINAVHNLKYEDEEQE